MKNFGVLFAILFLLSTLSTELLARERDKNFRKGRGGHQRGNERSERPGRVPVGNPTHGGNGCPAGTMRVAFSPDSLSFSILFDQFVAEAAGGKGQKRDVMACDALIPIEIPANMQMEITRVDYRGFVALPQHARARLHTIFNFRGRGGDGDRMNMRFDFQGPVADVYEITTDLLSDTNTGTEISPCGGQTVLRVYNQMQVISRKAGEQAQATIDSIDGSSNAIYHLNWKACTGRNGDNGRDDRDNGRGGRGPGRR